jgi:type IV secretory pathway TrbD component
VVFELANSSIPIHTPSENPILLFAGDQTIVLAEVLSPRLVIFAYSIP